MTRAGTRYRRVGADRIGDASVAASVA